MVMASVLFDFPSPSVSLISSKTHFGFLTNPTASSTATRNCSVDEPFSCFRMKPTEFDYPIRSLCTSHQQQDISLLKKSFDMNGSSKDGEIMTHQLSTRYHGFIIKGGLNWDNSVTTRLLSMYVRCRDLDGACKLFDEMPDTNVANWNSLISELINHGQLEQALGLFVGLLGIGIKPNHYTFSIAFKICGELVSTAEGKQVHGLAVKSGFLSEAAVGNAALAMYGKFGMMKEAEMLFQNLPNRNYITCTAFLTSLSWNKCFEEALRLFFHMRRSKVLMNEYAYTVALDCCSSLNHAGYGRIIHALTLKDGYASGIFVGTAIVDMYSNCAKMVDAERQLADMEDAQAAFNAHLAGYVSNNMNQEALEAFSRMLGKSRTNSDEFTYSTILKACSSILSLATGEQIHAMILKTNHGSNFHIGTSLIDMYSRCGFLEEAIQVFNHMKHREDTVLWNSILKAFSQHGCTNQVFEYFDKMIDEGIRPTNASFLAILSSCSHSGLIEEGLRIFHSMSQEHGITAEDAHYSCIVDLFGRAGKLEEAMKLIDNLPTKPTPAIWRPLLAACRCYGNVKMAEFVAKCILEEDPKDPTVYVTLSNTYAKVGRLNDVVKQRQLMTDRKVKKEPGCSWIEVDRRVHKFFSKDRTHPQTIDIYNKLEELRLQIREMGHIVDAQNGEDDNDAM